MRKQIFVNLILVFLLSSNLFSQECQIIRDDSNGVTTRIFEDDSKLRYFTHELLVRLDTLRRDDPEYMQQVNNFIISLNCIIIRVYEDTPPLNTLKGYVYLGLADTMDAFNYIEIFTQSGLFLDVGLNAAGKLNDIFFNPNDPKFNEQWYLKQTSNRDIDAEKAWTITKGDSSKVRVYVIDSGIILSAPVGVLRVKRGVTNR